MDEKAASFLAAIFVIYSAVCGIHRLISRSIPAHVGVSGLDIPLGQLARAFACYILMILLVPCLLAIVAQASGFSKKISRDDLSVTLMFSATIITVPLIMACCKKKDIFDEILKARVSKKRLISSVTYDFGVMCSAIILLYLSWGMITSFLEKIGITPQLEEQGPMKLIREAKNQWSIFPSVLSTVVLAPITEEIVFRGIIYRTLKSTVNENMACMMTAFLFAFVHFNILAFVPLFLASIFFSRVYEKNADIRGPMLMHALFNAVNIAVAVCVK